MNRSRSLITLLAVAIVTGTIVAGAAMSGGEPPWLKALNARSEALNGNYGLGDSARSTARTDSQAWQRVLIIRSDALNRKYGLGRYARTPAGAEEPAWVRALMIRSDALNRRYGLGEYAPRPWGPSDDTRARPPPGGLVASEESACRARGASGRDAVSRYASETALKRTGWIVGFDSQSPNERGLGAERPDEKGVAA